MRGVVLVVSGVAYLTLLCLNILVAPGNRSLAGTFAGLEPAGQIVAVAVAATYVFASLGVVFLLSVVARKRFEGGGASFQKDLRDVAWLLSILGIGSLLPWSVVALMRADSAGSGPLVNGATVVTVSCLALVAAVALTLAGRTKAAV